MIPFKTAFIVNPTAGGGGALRIWRRLEPLLRHSGQAYQVHYTRWRGDATAIAEKARAGGAELIIGVGGDGTMLEVANGLDLEKNILGIIPAGTGNGFYRSLKIPRNCRKALLGMAGWEPRRVDLATFNGIRFLNIAGFGFDAVLTEYVKNENQKLPGYSAYVAGFLKELATFKDFQTVATVDQHNQVEESNTFVAMVANGCYYGGLLCVAPHADITDGELNLLLVRRMNYLETAVVAVRAFLKTHLSHSAFHTVPGRRFTISADGNIPVQIDGELLGSLPATVEVLPGALQVLAPKM
ncbi:MAG: diacylglycerol kinase family lipid kinase [Firmicutes bacterium]|nr:diacylglycerol kinase family lipid kinase [Bacillota bacterium]